MRYAYLALGALLGCVLFLFALPMGKVQAHFCDDNYVEQKDRENCWWRYWNGLPLSLKGSASPAEPVHPIPDAEPVPDAAADGTFCDRFYTSQQDRENCWWRYWNGLPLYLEDSACPTEPVQPVPDAEPVPDAAADGTFCDRFYTSQQDRENCWWRYWNGLPLYLEDSACPTEPVQPVPDSEAASSKQHRVTRSNSSRASANRVFRTSSAANNSNSSSDPTPYSHSNPPPRWLICGLYGLPMNCFG